MVFLCLVIVASLTIAPPVTTLAELEKRIVSEKDEYYLGETVNVKVLLVNSFNHDVRLEPITRITYGTTQAGKPWINADVNIDVVHGSMYYILPHGNLTILDEAVTPTEPGEFRFNAFGESLTAMIYPYREASVISPNVYLNISAPSKVKAGERFTAVFSIVNDNPYHVKLPAYNTFDVQWVRWGRAIRRGQPHRLGNGSLHRHSAAHPLRPRDDPSFIVEAGRLHARLHGRQPRGDSHSKDRALVI